MQPRFEDLDAESLALVGALLPRGAQEFARIIGFEKTLALVDEFGGTSLNFPRTATGPGAALFAELANVIGAENAARMGAEYGPLEDTYIPRCLIAMNALRNREITIAFDKLTKEISARKAVNKLARLYRLSAKGVEDIVNGKTGKGPLGGFQRN